MQDFLPVLSFDEAFADGIGDSEAGPWSHTSKRNDGGFRVEGFGSTTVEGSGGGGRQGKTFGVLAAEGAAEGACEHPPPGCRWCFVGIRGLGFWIHRA